MNKFHAKRTTIDGITFHSKSEAKRWCELQILAKAGEISDLKRQQSYALRIHGALIAKYQPDFQYLNKTGTLVIEEHKGKWTPDAKLKIAMFEAIYGIPVLITGAAA